MLARAFTLIELSVVLIIIGLVVGGVMVGHDLVKAAQVRAQMTQVSELETQINTFRGKYDCLPGDCTTATNFLPAADGQGNTLVNGDGDGRIRATYGNGGMINSSICIGGTTQGEISQIFLHLNVAKMGNYLANGTTSTNLQGTAGKEFPFAAYGNGSGIVISCLTDTSFPTYMAPFMLNSNTNVIIIGFAGGLANRIGYGIGSYGAGAYGGFGNSNFGPLLNIGIPADVAQKMDAKMDDGKPLSGVFGAIAGDPCIETDIVAAATPVSYPTTSPCRLTAGKLLK